MGLIHGQVTSHQRHHPAENDRLYLCTIRSHKSPPGELLRICRQVGPSDQTNGPVLKRLSDLGNRMIAHRKTRPFTQPLKTLARRSEAAKTETLNPKPSWRVLDKDSCITAGHS